MYKRLGSKFRFDDGKPVSERRKFTQRLFLSLSFATKPGGRGSCERDDPRPRETKARARARERLSLRVASSFSAYRSPRYTARVRQWLNERENRNRFLALAAGTTHRRCCRNGTETKGDERRAEKWRKGERIRYAPPHSGRHRAPVTALRPIGKLRRGRKDAIAKRCPSPSPLPLLQPPCTAVAPRNRVVPRGPDGTIRAPAFSSALASHQGIRHAPLLSRAVGGSIRCRVAEYNDDRPSSK